ncbi:MAG: carotenoid biosynthesis protein [Robiginitalea sp.]
MNDRLKTSVSKRTAAGVFLLWLLHLSGLIGIAAGAADWFIPKTPLNLVVTTLIFFSIFPLNSFRKTGFTVFVFAVGMTAEWIGVHTGYLFGTYSYGENLGPRLDGIPYLIGFNWAILSLASGSLSDGWKVPKPVRIGIGALIMVGLDFFIEGVAPLMDLWTFRGGAPPVWNYVCWFGLALFFQWVYQRSGISGNRTISLHLIGVQLVFFIFLNVLFPGHL